MIIAIVIVFILGYTAIALEQTIKINKAATALTLGMLLWTMYIYAAPETIVNAHPDSFKDFIYADPVLSAHSLSDQATRYVVDFQIIKHLGNIAEIIFYLLGAMTIVSIIDFHGGFATLTDRIRTRDKQNLLWLIAIITFFMSSVLDNLTTAIVMIMMVRRLVSDRHNRWIFGSMVIIAANCGGAWTPIGDVTTIMLWINNNITSSVILRDLFLPSMISMIVPVFVASRSLKGDITTDRPQTSSVPEFTYNPAITWEERVSILTFGIACLLAVPVFKSVTGLPPFTGILFALGLMWIYMEILYNRKKDITQEQQFRVPYILSKLDLPTILFFLGILMAVAALEAAGVLGRAATFLDVYIHNTYIVNVCIGFLSSIIDNVPLVAAAIGMYPILTPETADAAPHAAYMLNFVQDGTFWQLLAYCAGVGGNILIIGSTAGVVVMGLQRINFIWYMKHISLPAIGGYLAGILVFVLQKLIF